CNSTANTLRVVATGEDATHLPLTYQWYKDNVAIPGATSSSYTPTKAGSGNGAYHCVVSANGNVVHTTDKANISFVDGVPELTFNENTAEGGVEIPSEIFCSQEIGAVMKVTFDEDDVTDDYNRFWWINNHSKAMEGITETGVHTYSFNCDGSQYTATIGAYIRDNASGCVVTITKDVTVNPMGNVYYYCGPDGDGSDVTSASNWCTVENGNPASCTHPLVDGENKFYEPGSQYIINKDNVVLKSGQEWKVAGTGSKITIGDGNWSKDNFTSVGNDWNRFTNNAPWGVPNGNYAESIGTFTGQSMQGQMTKIAEHDYRDYAKKFTISGTLTTYEDVNVDVNNGSSVNVTTTDGNFSFGDMAKDEITHADGNANGYYNIVVKPGSSVTYSGNGAKKIRSGDYSQLYIQDVATDNLGDICFETSANVTVAQVLKNTTSVSLDNINPNGSTVEYVGTVNQEVAPLKYWNLRTESASNKTLIGDIEVANSLYIGAGSTLVAGNVIGSDTCDITVSGGGEHAVEMVGHFKPGVSTFTYASGSETTIEAMNYFNLNLGSNDRTLSSRNVIGIAGSLITDGGSPTYTVEGSTVEFNGGVKQHIPEFTFYNLTINDTAMRVNTGSSLNEAYFIEMDGDVTVQNNIILTEGVLRINAPAKANEEDPDPDPYVLMLSNPASSAIGQGYYTSAQRACYINGAITHVMPENLSNSSTIYYFPVGDDQDYKPLMLNSITTTANPQVTVGVEYAGIDGTLKEEGKPDETISTSDAWFVEGNAGYTSGSVGVSKASGLATGINALAYGTTRTGDFFEDIYGSEDDGSILYSDIRSSGYYALISRDKTDKTYYYDCSGGKDITDINSWHVEENGGGARATRFDEIDAKWIIKCGTTISDKLTINGSNSVVEIAIPKGEELVINDT
ncbi:MAG: immunoglobulin domain-containing protein, partial [Bacteroidales bacterium]|nr:immunoglobulin domain-containing protein [Bacteroidales bacterium]